MPTFGSQEQILSFITSMYNQVVKPELLHKSYFEDMVFYLLEADYNTNNNTIKVLSVTEVVFTNVRIIGYSYLTNQTISVPSGNITVDAIKITLEMNNPKRININSGNNIFYVLVFYFLASNPPKLVRAVIDAFSNTQNYYNSINDVITKHPDFNTNGHIISFNQLTIGI